MKTGMLILLIIVIANCGSKNKKDWGEQNAKANCVLSYTTGPDAIWLDSLVERKNVYRVCDCVIEKAAKLYDDEETMLKDKGGFSELVNSCIDKVKEQLGK